MHKRSPAWAVVLWAVVIFVTSSTVVTTKQFVKGVTTSAPVHLTQQQFGDFWHDWWWLFVKGWHVLEFAILSVVVYIACVKTGRHRWRSLLAAFLSTMIYAATDEYHQTFVPMRGGRVSDWLIDGIGALLALAICGIWAWRSVSLSEATRTSSTSLLESGLAPDGPRPGT